MTKCRECGQGITAAIKSHTQNPVENAINGYKGEFAGCEYFGIPFGWEILNRGDGGKDVRVGEVSIEFKTSWDPPWNTHVLLPQDQTLTADYVVQLCGSGTYVVAGYLTKDEFFQLRHLIEKMWNRPWGVHAKYCHPIQALKEIVDGQKDYRLQEYAQECAARRSIFEAELGPEALTGRPPKPHWVDPPKKGQQSLFKI